MVHHYNKIKSTLNAAKSSTDGGKPAKNVTNHAVPMILFLSCTGVRDLEAKLGKPVETLDFSNSEVFELPVFGGRYYTSLQNLANQITNYASNHLNCPLSGNDALMQFLAFIREGNTRVEAAKMMRPRSAI